LRKTDKLTDEQVHAVKELYATGQHSSRSLGRMFNVSHTQVQNIVNGVNRVVSSEDRFQRDKNKWKTVPKKLHTSARFNAAPVGLTTNIGIPAPEGGLKIAVITDGQAKDGVPLDHFTWCGEYLERKRPDVILCIGDFGDFPSLSRFDRGTRKFEGRRYVQDLDAFHRAMEMLMNPIVKVSGWNPYMEFTLGNHEDRIERITIEDAKLEGLISQKDLDLEAYGWRVHPFLQPVNIAGVAFAHYFPSGVLGRPITTATELLRKLHMSAFAGHLQGREIAYARRADGSNMTAIISGSFYQHDEDYLSPFTNKHWRGFYMLHEVSDGSFDEMAVSISFLKKKFEQRHAKKSKKPKA
jgi:hypothetical protein